MGEEHYVVERQTVQCVVCREECFAADGRGYCRDCNITFPIAAPSRKKIFSEFMVKFYMSRNSPFYHRAGCKYLRNVSPENLIETTEPQGKPCLCVR